MAIRPLLKELQKEPGIEVVLTTTTSTGLRVLKANLAELVIWHGVFPMDFWPFSRKAWQHIDPDLAVLMEGELWPEHIHQAKIRQIPMILVNARLSDRSFQRHYKFRKMARCYFKHLSIILAGSASDRRRLVKLNWVESEKIQLTGNLKLDVELPESPSSELRAAMLKEFGMPEESLLLIGSSTWSAEESALIDAYKSLKENYPVLRLLIVPRHAERKQELQAVVATKEVSFHFRSDSRQAPVGTEVYIADTTGEQGMLTNYADIVFVGKSIPPNSGGQTPVEAAAMGKPLIFGPDMSNFKDISRNLVKTGAAEVIQSGDDLASKIEELLLSPEHREQMGNAARSVILESRGATQRVILEIKKSLNQES